MLTYEAILPSAMTIGATLPLFLSALGAICPELTKGYLPIGKSDFVQFAIFLTLAFGIVVIAVEGGKLARSVDAPWISQSDPAAPEDAAGLGGTKTD